MRTIVLVLLFFLPLSSSLFAQVDRVRPAFQLTHFESLGNGEYFYRYRLIGFASDGRKISDVYLDVTQPKGQYPSRVVGIRGRFLFDAVSEFHRELPFGHPPLFIASPTNWSAAIYRHGVLSWGASRWAGGPDHGVAIGEVLEGFELRSTALPALRRYRAVPNYRFPSAGGLGDLVPDVDTTLILFTGLVLAPGWEAEFVTGDYLREQVVRACDAHLVDNCGRYLRLTDAILDAEQKGQDRVYENALVAFLSYLAEDNVSHSSARLVFDLTANALRARPPSRRKASTDRP